MHELNPNTLSPFQVRPQQTRQLSCNFSTISSNINTSNSYQQLHQSFQQLSSNLLDMTALHQSPHLKLKKYKEAVYYGEHLQGKRQGKGIMLYHNGQRYDGDWLADQRHGQGIQVFANGSVYEGDYFQNKMQGQGKYIHPDGQTYQGEWSNNLKHGSGMWINPEGNCYVGEWAEGTATGFGIFTEANASRYEGSFIGFVKNGKGTQKFVTGDLYQGNYEDGRFHGFGQFYWRDGSFYKGQFVDGKKHGYGVWRKGSSNQKYEGQFYQNRKEGYGIYTWSNGNVYKGHYHSNLRHGSGEMFWCDGTFYKGEWLVDKPNGRGSLFDGMEVTKGVFQDGQLVDYDKSEEGRRGISQFYLDGPTTKRVVGTPIRKITEDMVTERNHQHKLNLSQVQKDAQVRQIKPYQSSKKRKILAGKDVSFARRKLIETINLEPRHYHHQRKSSTDNRSVGSKSQSREKVLHSGFQIHRLYNNHKNKRTVYPSIQPTSDSSEKFAFSTKSSNPRPRYFSKLQ